MIYLYDPRTNVTSKTSYEDLYGITGMAKTNLAVYKSRKYKLRSINCYIIDKKVPLNQRREWYAKETYPDEAWKTIKGSDRKFLISNYGRVQRVYSYGTKFLLPYQRKGKGNLFVKTKFKDKYGEYKVGKLVAEHFIKELNPGENVIRKNGIITDDYVLNLDIVNNTKLGKMTGYKSNSKPVVQLDPDTLEVINEFRSVREAGRECYLSHEAVRHNCIGKSKTSGGYIFMFADEYEEVDMKLNS